MLNKEINAALKDPGILAKLKDLGGIADARHAGRFRQVPRRRNGQVGKGRARRQSVDPVTRRNRTFSAMTDRKRPEDLRSHRWLGVDDMRSFGHRSRLRRHRL